MHHETLGWVCGCGVANDCWNRTSSRGLWWVTKPRPKPASRRLRNLGPNQSQPCPQRWPRCRTNLSDLGRTSPASTPVSRMVVLPGTLRRSAATRKSVLMGQTSMRCGGTLASEWGCIDHDGQLGRPAYVKRGAKKLSIAEGDCPSFEAELLPVRLPR